MKKLCDCYHSDFDRGFQKKSCGVSVTDFYGEDGSRLDQAKVS